MPLSRTATTPDFLIVGAMKAGTTTLYRDLCLHPDIYMPPEKEPETLVKLGSSAERMTRDYASLFRFAPAGAVLGEASTAYTKRPMYEGVAERAKQVCGPDLRIVYLRRDPVKRIISHYKHAFGSGETNLSFEEAVKADPLYVAISRYDWQIQPWLDTFGPAAVLQIAFEDYVKDRHGIARLVCGHIGADLERLPPVDEEAAFNVSDNKPIAHSRLTQAVVASRLYQRVAKPLIPASLRDHARSTLLPKAPPVEVRLSPSLTAWLASELVATDNKSE